MGTFLFEKKVDQSLLKYGFTIPINMHRKIQDALGVQLSKGQSANITIFLDEERYDATLYNIGHSDQYSTQTDIQIRGDCGHLDYGCRGRYCIRFLLIQVYRI